MRTLILLAVLALPVGVGRFLVPGHGLSLAGTYEAFAHIWVGAMLALAILRWPFADGKLAALLLALLTVLETAMFLSR